MKVDIPSIKKHCIEISQVTNVSMESKNGGRGNK